MVTVRLSEVGRQDLAVAGGKGANLGEMIGLGLPVPQGFCVTAPAYAAQVEAWGLAAALVPVLARGDWAGVTAVASGIFREQPLAPATEAAILQAYHEMGEPPVAVRSSATAEDLADASFAGQQETFLNVRGGEALLRAVRDCWASLWAPRAVHYREQRSIDHLQVSMAVVVQEMVDAEAAGVLFTVDPVTRRGDRMLVEAAPGLGEAVVSGDVTGDLYRLARAGEAGSGTGPLTVVERQVRRAGRPVLSDAWLSDLAAMGLRLEAHFGCPQDVEFAVAGGRLYLLQARPITTLAVEPEPVPEERLDWLQRRMLAEGQERYPLAPRPLDNLFWSVNVSAVTGSMRQAGFTVSPTDEERLHQQLWRTVYVAFPPVKMTLRSMAGMFGLMVRTLDFDWQGWWEQGPQQQILAVTAPVAVGGLSDRALLDRVDALLAIWREAFVGRFGIAPALFTPNLLRRLTRLVVGRRLSGQVFDDLMAGLRTRTGETNEALWRIAQEVRADADDWAAVATGRFGDVSPALRARAGAFLAEYGHREGTTWYLSTPTWRQEPLQFWRLLRGLVAVEAPPKAREGRYEAAVRLVEGRLKWFPWLRRRFWWLLERVRALTLFRENSHFDLTRPLASLQEAVAECGRRLTDRGLLGAPDDIFYLTFDEVQGWLAETAPGPEAARRHIGRRRETYKMVNGRWQGRQFRATPGGADLRGVAASAGVVRAKARIIASEADWHRLAPGEVMVCPYTNPAWTPLFAAAAAVVTETGGAGAHAAIVAREYGIPAVMGVPGATRLIADGQEVLVDGGTGRVLLGQGGAF
ncbi:MAG: ppsA3 [Symbiobacteriaceae bacterium]|jgi:pyruvate,water dikinase|nr:ppsA3 [Symbiobacteriaceae bacterium]